MLVSYLSKARDVYRRVRQEEHLLQPVQEIDPPVIHNSFLRFDYLMNVLIVAKELRAFVTLEETIEGFEKELKESATMLPEERAILREVIAQLRKLVNPTGQRSPVSDP
jgi:hypothetical protein